MASLVRMSPATVEYHRAAYSTEPGGGGGGGGVAPLSVKGISQHLANIFHSIESCSCGGCSPEGGRPAGSGQTDGTDTGQTLECSSEQQLSCCVQQAMQEQHHQHQQHHHQQQREEDDDVKDMSRKPDLQDILCRVMRQVAGNQREQELKDFFQNIRRSKEPHLNKDASPVDHQNAAPKDGDVHEAGAGRRNSLSKIWKKHSKKRRKKDGNAEENDQEGDINVERLRAIASGISEGKDSISEEDEQRGGGAYGPQDPPEGEQQNSRLPSVPDAPHQQEDGSSCSSPTNENMSMLQKLAFNALHLTAPASSLLLQERRNSWVQLSGHPGALAPAGPGTIWKKRAPESTETDMYRALMQDSAASIVPTFFKEIHYGQDYFIEMRDLLSNFHKPSIMDVKMGTRTFLEGEVANSKPRPDLYEKMVKVSPEEPTAEEREAGAVTKLRYMEFRDNLSSSRQLGFRVEAMKTQGSPTVTDMKKVCTRAEVLETMATFMRGRDSVRRNILERLVVIRDSFEGSPFFSTHEVIGCSILIIYDEEKAGVWLIDFAKTRALPQGVTVTHRHPWELGNHEEGFLFGIDNIIQVVEEVKVNKNKKLNFLRKC